MKKYIFCFTLVITTLLAIFTTTAFAQTTTVVIKPEYTEDTVVAINFKDGQLPGVAEYVYTGKKIMPEVVVTKTDNTIADPSEYIITYDDNCDELGAHFITVEYLKSGYKVAMDYRIVPGKTTKVDMTAKNGSVTLSWSAVKGATHYRVYQFNDSTGRYSEIYWEDGSIAAPKLSRTLNLEPGKTYNMGIMALAGPDHMPTNQMKTFKFTVPANGNGSLNIVPGNNKPVETSTSKPVTTTEPADTTVPTTDVSSTEPSSVTESSSTQESVSQTETNPTKTNPTETQSKSPESTNNTTKNNNIMGKLVPVALLIAAVLLISSAVVSLTKTKKK